MTEPVVSLRQFFDGARDGRLTAIRCGACGALAVPPKEFCACGARSWTTMPLSGEGAISSFTIIRVAPRGHTADAPYAIAAVRMAEGVSLLGRVVDVPLDAIKVGMAVRFRPLTRQGQTALGFSPA